MIEIKKLPSGFWAVFYNGTMWYAASPTKEHAESVARQIAGKEKK